MIGNRVFALKGDVNELKHLLSEPHPDIDKIRELQGTLQTNVVRIEEILQEFRDFLTATQLTLEPAHLNGIVQETVQEVFPKRSAVKLKLELDPSNPEAAVDEKKLRRAVSELVENAFNYMAEGELCVSTGTSVPSEARRAGLSPSKRYAKIEVEDSGPGVQPDQKGVIFQPFFSGRVKGMGLGLSIVKGIVDAHGGAVFEGGEPGQGAKFVILLPMLERSKSEKQ
jgi:signal transduction histidine kinase